MCLPLKSGKALPVLTYQERLNRLTSDVEYWIPYDDHRAYREFKLISLFSRRIRWGPSVVIHRPERIVRQFGYVQTIPLHSLGSRLCLEDIDDIYMHFSDYLALVDEICVVLGQCTSDYIN